MRIYLVGYMFSGKSTVGRHLAQQLNFDFIDLDEAFEEHYHQTVVHFFQRYDETAFRILETHLLQQTAQQDNIVVSCGGGTPCYGDNMQFILQHGYSIYLQLTIENILTRYAGSHRQQQRPLLRDLSPEELRQHVTQQMSEREPSYLLANHIVDGFNQQLEDIVNNITQWLQSVSDEK